MWQCRVALMLSMWREISQSRYLMSRLSLTSVHHKVKCKAQFPPPQKPIDYKLLPQHRCFVVLFSMFYLWILWISSFLMVLIYYLEWSGIEGYTQTTLNHCLVCSERSPFLAEPYPHNLDWMHFTALHLSPSVWPFKVCRHILLICLHWDSCI